MRYKIGDRFVVIKNPSDGWKNFGYHLVGWKGTITHLNTNGQTDECRWDNYYNTAPHGNEMPINYLIIKKLGTKKISCFAYWNMLYGK